MVRGLAKYHNKAQPIDPKTMARIKISGTVTSPVADARQAVLFIFASTFCSIKQFTAKAALAKSQIPHEPPIKIVQGTIPGVERNMPITAQKTASCVTRGFVKAYKCCHFVRESTGDIMPEMASSATAATVSLVQASEPLHHLYESMPL